MTTRTMIAGIAASLLVLSGVAACSPQGEPAPAAPATTAPAATTGPTTPNETTQSSAAQSPAVQNAEAHNAGAIQAIATAADAAGGTPYEIDDEDDDQVWEVDVMVGDRTHEVKVSRDGRTVIKQEEEGADAEDQRRLQGAGLSLAQAIERALGEVPGTLDDAELDDENNVAVWKVEIDTSQTQDVDVLIRVTDGQVVRVDR